MNASAAKASRHGKPRHVIKKSITSTPPSGGSEQSITDLEPEATPVSSPIDGPQGVRAPGAAFRPGEERPGEPLPFEARYNPGEIPGRPQSQRPDKGTVVLNFSDANLKDILRTVADITGENFIIAPGVTAKISVQTAKPVARKDVFGIFESILEVNGLAAVRSGPYYKIVPAQSAKQRALELSTEKNPEDIPEGDRLINLVVPIEFIPANDVIQVIKPALSQAGAIAHYPKTNTLIITDSASNIKSYLDIINLLDVDAFKRMNISVIPVKNVDVRTLNKELSEVFSALGFGKDGTQIIIVPIERLNSLIVFSASDELLASAGEWIERLDKPSTSDAASIHTYYVQNDKASNINNLLERLYGGKKLALTSLTHEAQTHSPQGTSQVTAQASTIKYDSPQKSEATRGEEIKIYIYEPTNALIIQSSERDYQSILSTVKELDRPPKQVLIDALIAEVKLDENTKYGIQWSALLGNFNIQQNTGIVSSTISNPRASITPPIGAAAPSGLSVFATDASKFFAVIQALASTGQVDVLSNPHVVVKNYEKASINVGSDEPVATQSTQTAVTGTTGLIQNIEYRKTGVILTVVPQITEGGMVAMTVRQEVSDKSTDRTVGNAVYPSFTKREAETSVVAKDRETLVIGGLIQEKKDRSTTGIPLLSSIPIIGGLFRYTTRNDGKTELVILLTPTVISNAEQAAKVTDEVKGRLSRLRDLLKERVYRR